MLSNKDPREFEEQKNEDGEEYSFLQETIKREPVTGKMIAGHLGRIAVCGIVFGIVACISFCALKPWAENFFQKNPEKITIPRDEEEQKDGESDEKEEDVIIPEFTVERMEEMQSSLYRIAKDAGKSVVEIKGIQKNEGWIRENFDTVNSVSGTVIADTGTQFLVLADNSIVENSKSFLILFDETNSCEAKLQKQDKNLGIAVFSVNKSLVKSGILHNVKPIVLGNSNLTKRGDIVIALGKPFGYSGGYGNGVVSSVRKSISPADGDYGLILTDIPGSEKGTGLLINMRGEMIGLIQNRITSGDHVQVSNALAISDLKATIELLSNNQRVPYIGIYGTDVTEHIAEEQGIPRGVYVKSVEAESPAMEAGIQAGDIITSVGKVSISTLNAYQNAVIDYKVDEEIILHGKRKGNGGYVEIDFQVTVGSRE